MWMLVAREAPPDAPDWPGRRLLGALDALVWPLLWVLFISHAPKPVGLIGPFVTAVAVLCALGRLHRALWCQVASNSFQLSASNTFQLVSRI